ncbi:uncharacterized protein UTRI_00328_B [Ustilago trichophora]|uniref:Polysaccharide lyase 14 domain-containing protein n=1 Tax=Ustilago trichophora TaxID=86804 RepID=A0A5C3DR78_9BASI|nr:uncharacterized protein UTRI_00328_B [Ustilago trichophora]
MFIISSKNRGRPRWTTSPSGTGVGGDAASIARARTTAGATWIQETRFKNLDDLRITYYSSGQSNSKILTGGLPTSAFSATAPKGKKRRGNFVDQEAIVSRRPNRALRREEVASPTTTTTTTRRRTSSTSSTRSTSSTSSISKPTATTSAGSVLEIFYPANSYTPSELPVGGTQFYALSPFDLSLAASVTFNYSVFFPAYYNFVLGGKLPGLYGGTEGCGGGNSAQNCWSTRMAWRSNGTGELYAYLPQDKQNTTALLQVPPYSYVNSDYGISLGRGALNYSRGGWTEISQTITLSTNDSHPNGIFDIKVNGSQAIYYDQVYYPTGIKGVLFSTFFGGATRDWATPVDQYSYFRAFSVRINSLSSSNKR